MSGLRTAKVTTLRRATARVSEKTEQAHIVQLIRSIGGQVYVIGTTRPRGDHHGTCQTPGIPDLIAFLPRRVTVADGVTTTLCVFIECKAVGGRLRPEQAAFRAQALESGIAHVVGTLDAVIAFLVEHRLVKADAFPHYRQPSPAPSPKELV